MMFTPENMRYATCNCRAPWRGWRLLPRPGRHGQQHRPRRLRRRQTCCRDGTADGGRRRAVPAAGLFAQNPSLASLVMQPNADLNQTLRMNHAGAAAATAAAAARRPRRGQEPAPRRGRPRCPRRTRPSSTSLRDVLFPGAAAPHHRRGGGARAGRRHGGLEGLGSLPWLLANLPGGPGGGAAAPVDTRPPEERYEAQLRQLNDMGFVEFERNIEALRRSGGSVQGAVEYLLSNAS